MIVWNTYEEHQGSRSVLYIFRTFMKKQPQSAVIRYLVSKTVATKAAQQAAHQAYQLNRSVLQGQINRSNVILVTSRKIRSGAQIR